MKRSYSCFVSDEQLNVELFQISPNQQDFTSNAERILESFHGSSAQLCIFPEACTSGFAYDALDRIDEANQKLLVQACSAAQSRRAGMLLPLIIREESNVYVNRSYLIGSSGEILCAYDKIHLIDALDEKRHLKPGTAIAVAPFAFPGGVVRIGLATCYDLRFPELFRRLCLQEKAQLIILSAMWPQSRMEHMRILSQARAIENQAPFLCCNAVGPVNGLIAGGGSLSIDERGRIMAEASYTEETNIRYVFDGEAQDRWRAEFPALLDAGRT